MNNREQEGFDASLLTQALELVQVGTWAWDVRTDALRWSDEMFRLLALEPQTLTLDLGTYLSFVHPDDRARVEAIVESALADKKSFQFDHRLVTATGELIHHHSRGSVVCDATGEVVRMIGASIDITDRVIQQDALRASEERFRSIFEQSAVGLALAESDGTFVKVNRSLAHFLGFTPEELKGKSFRDCTHPDDLALTERKLRENEASLASFSYEKRYVRKDGKIVWGRATITRLRNDDGSLDGSTAVIEDITERKVSSEALKSQRKLLQTILDHLPVMISMFDQQGKPMYVNKEWQNVIGYTLEEAQAIDLFNVVYPDPSEAERALTSARDGIQGWRDFSPKAKDGKTVHSSWASIKVSDGTSITIGQDMTERDELQQRLMQAQKMEALGQLAGGVAHDFNNILTIISACAAFLLDDVSGNATAVGDVQEIISAADRAAALTRQLLAFSRRQLLKPEIVDVNESIQVTARSLRRLIGEHIQLSIVPAAKNSTVVVDVHQLEQVVLNLVVNARDAIQDSGTITIETSNRFLDGIDDVGEYLVLSVTDDGCGIDPSARDHIFEPFFTTKPVGQGTGLGLATVDGIVQQSGGRIEVEGKPGRGTTFHVLLPVVEARAATVIDLPGTEKASGKETILVVEDETALRGVLSRILTGLGYSVLVARHGADAAQLSADFDGPIHLLITDVVMPEMGGRELVSIIRKHRRGTPVLYISGYTDDELLRNGILEPGARLLRKPFTPSELARCVGDLLLRPQSLG